MASKKKAGASFVMAGNSPTHASFAMNNSGNSPNAQGVNSKNIYGKVQARPAARDGHSGIISNGRFIVFGGDRHQCPFNDLHFLDIDKEFELRDLN